MTYKPLFAGLLASGLLVSGIITSGFSPEIARAETAEATAAETTEKDDTTTAEAAEPPTEPPEATTPEPDEAKPTQAKPEKSTDTAKPKAAIQSKTSIDWVPLARINPEKPVTIELNNKTQEELEYLITTHTNFRTLAPGQTASVIVTDFPAFLNINAKRSIGVKYLMRVSQNKVKLDLNITGGQGDTTLNIHEKGAIYLY
ncbi:hypothetical protein IQ266_20120 [filamentous cyanobacterium LEGE 11480]|uniref:Uncharacterized protein n=1 Tax=Romeriopsis navalis LEGE 11480 TaxID=2777977 RepID=A0A928VQQ4_9CYAN|nr:hypothetical protein [Romeriopsis navalis]MBE9032048.1 hypothetical protein [Romeriopsis navalis LEGE 11480]